MKKEKSLSNSTKCKTPKNFHNHSKYKNESTTNSHNTKKDNNNLLSSNNSKKILYNSATYASKRVKTPGKKFKTLKNSTSYLNNEDDFTKIKLMYSPMNISAEEIKQNYNNENLLQKMIYLEDLISKVKENAYERIKNELINKLKEKDELENNINILNTKINNFYVQKRNYNQLNKFSYKEKYKFNEKKYKKLSEDNEQSINVLTNEINWIKQSLLEIKQDTQNVNFNIIEIDRTIKQYKDQIHNLNTQKRNIKNEIEIIKSSLTLLFKHILLTKEKIQKQNYNEIEFFKAMNILAKRSEKSKIEDEEIRKNLLEKKINKRGRNLSFKTTHSCCDKNFDNNSMKDNYNTTYNMIENYGRPYSKGTRKKPEPTSFALRKTMYYFYNPKTDSMIL